MYVILLFMVTGTPCCLVGYKDNLWSKSISYLDKIFRQNHILADNEEDHTFQKCVYDNNPIISFVHHDSMYSNQNYSKN